MDEATMVWRRAESSSMNVGKVLDAFDGRYSGRKILRLPAAGAWQVGYAGPAMSLWTFCNAQKRLILWRSVGPPRPAGSLE